MDLWKPVAMLLTGVLLLLILIGVGALVSWFRRRGKSGVAGCSCCDEKETGGGQNGSHR